MFVSLCTLTGNAIQRACNQEGGGFVHLDLHMYACHLTGLK